MTIYCGVDLHARQQTVAYCDTADGELHLRELGHGRDRVRGFYSSLTGEVVVGIEASGYSTWFVELLEGLSHQVLHRRRGRGSKAGQAPAEERPPGCRPHPRPAAQRRVPAGPPPLLREPRGAAAPALPPQAGAGADPRKNRLLRDGNKSDRVDARKLAQSGGWLPVSREMYLLDESSGLSICGLCRLREDGSAIGASLLQRYAAPMTRESRRRRREPSVSGRRLVSTRGATARA